MRLVRLALAAVLAATIPGLSAAGQATGAPEARAELSFLREAAQSVAPTEPQ